METKAYVEGQKAGRQWVIYDHQYEDDYPLPEEYEEGTPEWNEWMQGFIDYENGSKRLQMVYNNIPIEKTYDNTRSK